MRNWTREEEIIVFNLYCKIPFAKSNKNHPDVIRIANIIGRSPSAVNMKIGNFGRFDEKLASKGISGLTNGSKLDEEIWNEFNNKWDDLAFESEKLIGKLKGETILPEDTPIGEEVVREVKTRINQDFFRNTLLTSYNFTCCITGINKGELLVASHIKPWRDSDQNEKVNPRNGLLLNALHDKAFDKGYITVDTNYKIVISKEIRDLYSNDAFIQYFQKYDGKLIDLPEKFMPEKTFLEFHNKKIFRG